MDCESSLWDPLLFLGQPPVFSLQAEKLQWGGWARLLLGTQWPRVCTQGLLIGLEAQPFPKLVKETLASHPKASWSSVMKWIDRQYGSQIHRHSLLYVSFLQFLGLGRVGRLVPQEWSLVWEAKFLLESMNPFAIWARPF